MDKESKIIICIIAIILIGGLIFFIYINNKKGDLENEIININEKYKQVEESYIEENNIENNYQKIIENKQIKLKINNRELTATLEDNSSAEELVSRLSQGSITINMRDYSNFEKVGDLGFDLPRNDENISTNYGDLILYQGNSFVIYYDKNNWNLTRLGKIDNITQNELKSILGDGNVTVTIELIK